MKVNGLARTYILSLMVLAAAASPRAAVAVDGEAIIECANFTSAVHLCDAIAGCDRDYKIQRRYFDAAMTCVMNWLDCDLYQRAGSPKFDDCPARAIERCQGVYGDMTYYLNEKALFQRSQLVGHCEDLDFTTEFLGGAPMGLDYDDDQGTCTALGTPLQSLDDWIACGDTYQTRLYAGLLSLVAPRSLELLEDNSFCHLFPEVGVNPVVCNSGFAPRPDAVGTPSARVGQIRKCQKALHTGLKQFLHRHLTQLESCTEDHMRCEIKKTYGLLSAHGYDECIARAVRWCDRLLATRDRMAPRHLDRIKKACDDITFDDMTGILGFSDIAATCNANSVNEVIACLSDKVRCIAWDSERFVETRMDEDTPPEYLSDYLTCGN
jgi:hypothetical protein